MTLDEARKEAIRVMQASDWLGFHGNYFGIAMPVIFLDKGVRIESAWNSEECRLKFRVRTDTLKFPWVYDFSETYEQVREMFEVHVKNVLPNDYRVFVLYDGAQSYFLARYPSEVLTLAKETFGDDIDDDALSEEYVADVTEKSRRINFVDDDGSVLSSMYAEAVRVFNETGKSAFLASSEY